MIRLQAQALTAVRGGRRILSDVSVAAQGGEFIAVIGPNGSGKSTLLATLAGLLHADGGAVQLDGRPLAQIPRQELAQRRAYLPQSARCEWPLPVERMVALGLIAAPSLRASTVAEKARVDAALADCDLIAQRSQPVTTLSGGELARAMLARALVGDPQLLIVDEPLAGLDPRHAWDAAHRLRRLATEQGRLVIAALHDINIALRCATQVWAMKGGCLLANGPPSTTVTAEVLGELFEMQACVSGSGAQSYVDFAP